MKKIIFSTICVCSMLATSIISYADGSKDILKKEFIASCAEEMIQSFIDDGVMVANDAEMESLVYTYCDCAADKVLAGMTMKELEIVSEEIEVTEAEYERVFNKMDDLTSDCLQQFLESFSE